MSPIRLRPGHGIVSVQRVWRGLDDANLVGRLDIQRWRPGGRGWNPYTARQGQARLYVRQSGIKVSNNCTHADITALNRGPVNAYKRYKSSGTESEGARKTRLNANFDFYSTEVGYDNPDGTKAQITEPPPI